MARVTIEDCLNNVKNRFDLVLLATKRARQLVLGSDEAKLPWGKDKATVIALREIAEGHTDFDKNNTETEQAKETEKTEAIQATDEAVSTSTEEESEANNVVDLKTGEPLNLNTEEATKEKSDSEIDKES